MKVREDNGFGYWAASVDGKGVLVLSNSYVRLLEWKTGGRA